MSAAADWPPKPPRPPHPPQWRPPGLPDPASPPSRLPLVMPATETFDEGLASRLLRRRLVVLGGRIDDAAAAHAVATLLLLDEDDDRPIRVHLSCDDADLAAASLVADTVDLLRSPVHAVAVGTVGGAALAVVAAAAERTAHPQTLFVMREPQRIAGVVGEVDAAGAARLSDQQQRLLARLHERLSTASGQPVERIATDMHAGRVLGAADAVDYGLVQRLAGGSGADRLH